MRHSGQWARLGLLAALCRTALPQPHPAAHRVGLSASVEGDSCANQEGQQLHLLQQDVRLFNRAVNQQLQQQALEPSARTVAALREVVAELAANAGADAPPPASPAALEPAAPVQSTTANPTGVTLNAVGDFTAFVSSLVTNVATLVTMICIFMLLRVHYPLMYSGNVLRGFAPTQPDVTRHFSWFKAALSTTQKQHIETVGLDRAMLLHFPMVCMKICAVVGLPMFFILGPMHCFFGGHAAGEDHMSYFSAGNVQSGSWLYIVHSAVVWGVVYAVTRIAHGEQEQFMKHRWNWLHSMQVTRACTVLVSGIPEDFQSSAKLRSFFEELFPGDRIAEASCTRDTSELCVLCQKLSAAKQGLHEAQAMKEKDPSNPPKVRASYFGGHVDAADHYRSVIADIEPKVADSRRAILDASSTPGPQGFFCSTGFITFNKRSDAEIAKRMLDISSDRSEWIIEQPPEPSDIMWVDLMQDPTAQAGRELIGLLLMAGLYFAYMPLVIGLTNLAELIDLGPLQPLWAGIAPSFGITFMVSFLPSFIIWIFKLFFTLRAEAWSQHKLQIWYFWFQIVFVVMASAVGRNVRTFTAGLAENPLEVPQLLADTMPFSTHFYMNYMTLQWVTHCQNMLRYVNLSKFLSFCTIYEAEEAAHKAEPEDQEYYGIGSRSARWTTNMVIAIVYGTLCPPMWILTAINFAITRLAYGYLIPYAETKKPDLGGVFFVSQLRHLHHGLVIYVVLMTGVVMLRATTFVPAALSGASLVYIFYALNRFDNHFSWERLPFQELATAKGKAHDASFEKRPQTGEYVQPELVESS